jgi:predicted nucleic acid-binding protein
VEIVVLVPRKHPAGDAPGLDTSDGTALDRPWRSRWAPGNREIRAIHRAREKGTAGRLERGRWVARGGEALSGKSVRLTRARSSQHSLTGSKSDSSSRYEPPCWARSLGPERCQGRAPAQSWALPWPCVYEFFSVVTNPRIWKQSASTPKSAWAQIDAWLSSPSVRLLGETPDFSPLLARFLTLPRVRGAVVHDARVAALCVAHGVGALLTRDRDFTLFSDLRTRNPFA